MTELKLKPNSKTRARTPAAKQPVVFVISDSTGNLARHMLSAFSTQFPPGAISVRFESFVRTDERLKEVLTAAREARAAVCHAMVSPAFKDRIATGGR